MIGIIPAAGKATRFNGLPKYLLPVPGGYLLERMAQSTGEVCYIGANSQNYDLLDTYKRPADTVYLVNSRSMPQTICAARKYAPDGVMVGMPDTYWTDEYVFFALKQALRFGATCAVAVFPVDDEQRKRLGMCELSGGHIVRVDDKNPDSTLRYAWGALAWSQGFWKYIDERDPHMGIALNRAIEDGVHIEAYVSNGSYYDCATADDYFRMVRELTEKVQV